LGFGEVVIWLWSLSGLGVEGLEGCRADEANYRRCGVLEYVPCAYGGDYAREIELK
jgi:hypothetical protein